MTVDAYYSEPQYLRHLLPIFALLPDRLRGTLFKHPKAEGPGTPGYPRETIAVVASIQDHRAARSRRCKTIFVEHGAGQTYCGVPGRACLSGSYAGGRGREDVLLFICPNEEVASANSATYPAARTAAVGCPALDSWHQDPLLRPAGDRLRLVISFHADLNICPETRSALEWYRPFFPELKMWADGSGIELVGHAHPRALGVAREAYAEAGIPCVTSIVEVLATAVVYLCDNSSTLYEVASLDRPVIALNAPWYRREVHHGLRFWDAVPGLQVDDPRAIPEVVHASLLDPPDASRRRNTAVTRVYNACDGLAAERAVSAILDLEASLDGFDHVVRHRAGASGRRRG